MNKMLETHFPGGRLIGTSYIRPPFRMARGAGAGPSPAAPPRRLPSEPPLAHAPSRTIVRRERPIIEHLGLGEWMLSWLHGGRATAS